MRFKYSDNGSCGFVKDTETNSIILNGNGKEARKFLKMATKLINKEFDEDVYDFTLDSRVGKPRMFEGKYENILNENID